MEAIAGNQPVGESAAESSDAARIAEYTGLRAESDRSAQLLSNAVWIAVTGFGLTLAGAAAASTNGVQPVLVPSVALLLSIQSVAITTLYASELWKYIRVGTYIRVYIEGYFRRQGDHRMPPMHWETWIVAHRALTLHIAAVVFLQVPVVVTGGLLACVAAGWQASASGASVVYLSYVGTDGLLTRALWLVVLLDVVLLVVLGHKLWCARQGDFGDGGKSVKALAEAADGQGAQP